MRYFLSFLLFFIAIVIPIKASAQENILSLDLPPLKMVYHLCAFDVYVVNVHEADRWHLTNACLRTVLNPLPI